MPKKRKKPKRGRPPTERGAYNPDPARQLGRVSKSDWETIKAAAKSSGKTFTQWAMGHLLKAADLEGKRRKQEKCEHKKTSLEFLTGSEYLETCDECGAVL